MLNSAGVPLRRCVFDRGIRFRIVTKASNMFIRASGKNPSILSVIRSYTNYKTSGEFAKLKDPSPGTLFYDEPKWPEVLDMTEEAVERRKRQKWYDELKALPTPHHKLFMINVERGRQEVFYTGSLCYNSLESYQYATKTTLKGPLEFSSLPKVDDSLIQLVKRIILTHHLYSLDRHRIMRILTNTSDVTPIAKKYTAPCRVESCEEPPEPTEHYRDPSEHFVLSLISELRFWLGLKDTTLVERPRLEAFWQHYNYRTDPTFKHRYGDAKTFGPMLQHKSNVDIMISSGMPICPTVSLSSAEVSASPDTPVYDYYPVVQGWRRLKRHLVATPGYWHEGGQFPLVTIDNRNKIINKKHNPDVLLMDLENSPEDVKRRLQAHSLMVNFATAASTAYNLGFTLYHELTFPLMSQHIITDGQRWFIQRFQLNTLAFGPDFNQDKQNLAWTTEEMKLYDCVKDGKIEGFNSDVLSCIIAALMVERAPVTNATPYIDYGAEQSFLERGARCWKHMAARRFNLGEYLEQEMPLWVKIYKAHEDAPPSPMLKWERQKYNHMNQFNWEIYNEDVKKATDERKRKHKERLFKGLHLKDD